MFAAGVSLPPEVAALGVMTGLGYGLAAVGLVLTFRQSRVLNLAHGQVGAFGAVLLASLVLHAGWSYWLAVAVALVASTALGATLQAGVVRRLSAAPPLVAVVATLAFAQVLLWLGQAVGGDLRGAQLFPQPPGVPSFMLGALLVTRADVSLLIAAPVLAAVLAVGFDRTRLGWAVRAAAANPSAARLLGLRADRLTAGVWATAGGLSALGAVLVLPSSGFATAEALGPGFLLRVLTAAAMARFDSIVGALAGGIAVGAVEQIVLWNGGDSALMAPILFAMIVIAVLIRRPDSGRVADPSSWLLLARPSPTSLTRTQRTGLLAASTAVALGIPFALGAADEITLTLVAGLGICAVSVWIAAALGGQLSLGQVAIAGVGAAVAASVAGSTGSSVLAMVAAPVAGAALATGVALFAVRDRGALLAVLTLALALAGEGALLGGGWLLGGGRAPAVLLAGRGAVVLAGVALVLATFGAAALARSSAGRRMAAARDNERTARAFALAPTALRLQAVAVAGALSGLAGALIAESLFVVTPGVFPAISGIEVVLSAVVGGLGSPFGALIGTGLVIGLPAFAQPSPAVLAVLNGVWLTVLLANPGGLTGLLARRRGLRHATSHSPVRHASPPRLVEQRREAPELRISGLSVRYGSLLALDEVDLTVAPGTAIAVVGPNGAGKSTLVDAIIGAVPASGKIELDGQAVGPLSPEERTRLGLVRSHQDGLLFPTLTTLDLAQLVRPRREDALALLRRVKLEGAAGQTLATLSTGMRRLAELACVLALEPAVLLLDEPSAGLAQAETEPLAELLRAAQVRSGFSLILVEHDLAFAEKLCDRAILLRDGRVSARAPLSEVLEAAG